MNRSWRSNLEAIPVGLYEKALPKTLSWEERLTLSRKTGFDFLEMSIDDSDERISRLDWTRQEKKELKNLVESTGVQIRSLSLSAHRRFPLGSEIQQIRAKALDIFKRAIDLSVELGIRLILVPGADNYYQESDQASQDLYLKNLGKGFQWASNAGVMLGLENWDIQINTLDRVMEYVDHFNSPWFQAYPDPGNLIFAGVDVISQLEYVRGHIAALHIKDTLPGQLRYVSPGEGKVPFVDVFYKLAEMGFQAPIVLELWTEEFPDAADIVEAAGKYIREQMAQGWNRYYSKQENQGD
jgi:predicted hexulose-6-phosphate isomerase